MTIEQDLTLELLEQRILGHANSAQHPALDTLDLSRLNLDTVVVLNSLVRAFDLAISHEHGKADELLVLARALDPKDDHAIRDAHHRICVRLRNARLYIDSCRVIVAAMASDDHAVEESR